MLELVGIIAAGCFLGYVAYGMWHSTTVDPVRPRRWKKSWSQRDQDEYDALVGQPHGGDA